jgi:hypothetical protein
MAAVEGALMINVTLTITGNELDAIARRCGEGIP